MKLIKLARRLPHLLTGALLAGLLAASFTVLPATPAHAADQYLDDFSLSADLSFQESFFRGEKKELSEEYETEDSNKICEKLKSEQQQSLKEYEQESKRDLGILNQKVDNCRFQGSLFFIDISGKYDEEFLKKDTSKSDLKIKNENEFEAEEYIPYLGQSIDIDKIAKQENIGIARYTFPGKIKSVTPNIGKISGNTWTIDKPLTSAELSEVARSNGKITITAERYGSKLGLILGITIPLTLIIAAVVVLLIVRSKRKQKQQNLPPYQAGYGTNPPSRYTPGNSANPVQSQVPRYPVPRAPGIPRATQPPMRAPQPPRPGAAGISPGQPPMPGTTQPPMPGASPQAGYPPQYGNFPNPPYPPNAPQGQPGAPAQGGYYPSQYPYPPANPQNPGAWNSPMPNQGYGAPTRGFRPPQAPSGSAKPGAAAASGQAEQVSGPKHAAYSPQPGWPREPGKPE